MGFPGGSDSDRAHQESFLYHLLGAKNAFLQELNVCYGCNLPQVSLGGLRDYLEKEGRKSEELLELYDIEQPGCWLFAAKKMRDHSTHVGGVPRVFHHGGDDHGKVFLRNPVNQTTTGHFIDEFAIWLTKMRVTIERLRQSAIQANFQAV